MRDPADIYTKSGTPILMVISRLAFAGYFLFVFWASFSHFLTFYRVTTIWLVYLAVLYIVAERIYRIFKKRGIDLTFAFPLLLVVYCLNIVSIALDAQNQLPILNRAEHFTSFILICYIVWIFFIRYLPQEVWRKHAYYTAILVFSVTSTAGVLNELVELLFDTLFHTSFIGLRPDTSLDLMMNTLGVGVFLAVRLILGTIEDE